jgi:hypothetical protein
MGEFSDEPVRSGIWGSQIQQSGNGKNGETKSEFP